MGSLCWAEADGDGGREHKRTVFFSFQQDKLLSLKEGGEGNEAVLPIDCLIAPVAVCLGPLAKSIIIFVAKVRLGRCPYRSLLLNRSAHKAQPGCRDMVHVDFYYSALPSRTSAEGRKGLTP